MNNNLSKQEKFLRARHKFSRSIRWLLASFGSLSFGLSITTIVWHNHPPLWDELIMVILLILYAVHQFLFVARALVYGWERLLWRHEVQLSKDGGRPLGLYVLFGYVVLSLILAGIIFIYRLDAKKCGTADCFVVAANNCDAVVWITKDKYDIEWYYYSSGCKLEKKLLAAGDNESTEMKNALEGKSLSCVYTKDNFNQDWLNSILGSMENCQGGLKDTIGKLLLFF